MRKQYLWFSILLCTWGCSLIGTKQSFKTNSQQKIKSFEIQVKNSDYSMGDNWTYVLTNQELKIIYRSDVVGSKDTTVLLKALAESDTLRKISQIDFSQLQGMYSNSCMSDGSRITVQIKQDGNIRSAYLANYYREEVGQLIRLLNKLTPDKYRIWYNKKALVALEKECKKRQ